LLLTKHNPKTTTMFCWTQLCCSLRILLRYQQTTQLCCSIRNMLS
jgi:hypothetical protein